MTEFIHYIDKHRRAALLLIIFFTFLAFYPALLNDFVNYDDPILVLENDIVHTFSLENTGKIFKTQKGRKIKKTFDSGIILFDFF